MTPAARVQAGAEILDAILAGEPAEKALTQWARRSRFAGSKDRAAVRDHVYDVLRRRASCGARGGGCSGRALMLGLLRQQGVDPDEIFTGQGHAPAPLNPAERAAGNETEPYDLPAWIVPRFQDALAEDFARTARALRERAPVMLRVNARKGGRDAAIGALARDGIEAHPCDIAETALRVTAGARRVKLSHPYADGRVELQDGSSQAAMSRLDLSGVARVLDFCAGGGGKSLALAARSAAQIVAHDAMPRRMADLPARAARAGAQITLAGLDEAVAAGPFDLVVCDVPCSGSGTWRRTPDAKWRLTEADLGALLRTQDGILDQAAGCVAPGGLLAYMTCSVLREENEARVAEFMTRHPDWRMTESTRWPVSDAGDGFFLAQLRRDR
ncbi:RsmB/NOP family class I SAM-dependent RNA methyltransferase [Roseovarius sp. E0-M6]|uniref:RsmB/NOP family class I SAM-dependent RNA methyltransferase n=1 Tax=Roseovarius sp. E0-M6 TaxID=3127118 RepID=UPI0030104DAE